MTVKHGLQGPTPTEKGGQVSQLPKHHGLERQNQTNCTSRNSLWVSVELGGELPAHSAGNKFAASIILEMSFLYELQRAGCLIKTLYVVKSEAHKPESAICWAVCTQLCWSRIIRKGSSALKC